MMAGPSARGGSYRARLREGARRSRNGRRRHEEKEYEARWTILKHRARGRVESWAPGKELDPPWTVWREVLRPSVRGEAKKRIGSARVEGHAWAVIVISEEREERR